MDKPTNLEKFRKHKQQRRAQAHTLCKSGFHKWQFDDKKQFDVQQGKLVSIEHCIRCGKLRTRMS